MLWLLQVSVSMLWNGMDGQVTAIEPRTVGSATSRTLVWEESSRAVLELVAAFSVFITLSLSFLSAV